MSDSTPSSPAPQPVLPEPQPEQLQAEAPRAERPGAGQSRAEPPRPPQAAVAAAAPRAAARWLLPLNLLLLGGVVTLGFVLLQQHQSMEGLANDAYAQAQRGMTLETRLAAAEAARAGLEQQLQSALSEIRASAQQTDVAALQAELDMLRRALAAQANPQHDWLLAEAGALLRVAAQQALHTRHVASAISLYESADSLLQRAADPALQPARAALQLELDALRAVQLPQIDSFYLQLGQLAQQLDALQVQSENEGPLRFTAPDPGAAPATASWWDELKRTLGTYFVVTRQDAPVLARLTPEQAFLIRQAIRLQLESARLALLQQDTRLYQAALDAALDGITRQLQGDARPALLASLQRLRAEAIEVSLPPLGAALQALDLLAAAEVAPPAAPSAAVPDDAADMPKPVEPAAGAATP